MLKTLRDKQMWLVSQPDHAELAGLLAANWGNDEFARPGQFASADDPEQLRAEIVLAIAQHDNGWWEWEAAPELSEIDGLPLDLRDVLKNRQEAMNRWRLGIPRFSRDHPYASLLISFHGYWLYAHGIQTDPDPAFAHPLFWKGSSTSLMGEGLDIARGFVDEIKEMQDAFIARLRKDQTCAAWIDTEHLNPHARLLQLLDGLSLSLCSPLIPPRTGTAKGFGDDEFDLLDVPRRSWEDRVTIKVKPASEGRIICEPYPFGVDPLPVVVPARILDWPAEPSAHFQSRWYSEPKQSIRFEYCSG
jgi:hypothetical protein